MVIFKNIRYLWALTMSAAAKKTHSLGMKVAGMGRYALFVEVREHCASKMHA